MSYDQLFSAAEQFKKLAKEKKLDPKAKVRTRGTVVFSAESKNVKDNKDHYPINDETQARNALARASQHKSTPPWYDGSLESLVNKVQRAVKKKYPSIETTKASKSPGKG
jgi:hypothetical protein